jgi:uncharacterized membrane protein
MRKLWLVVLAVTAGIVMSGTIGCSKTSEDKLAANTTCDTTSVSYATGVVPILQDNCYGCHGASSNAGSGGIVLEGYSNLKVYADNGYLSGNISHAPGYIGMPYGKPKLPDCEVNTVVAWVNQGAKNN